MNAHLSNVLLLGLGNIGYKYDVGQPEKIWTHYRAIMSHPSLNLVAAIENHEECRTRFQSATNCPAFSSILDFTQSFDGQVDIAVISTPTETHLEVFREVKKLQPKIVLIEKPLVAKNESFSELDEFEGKIFVNLIRLYHPLLADLIGIVREGGYCQVFVNCSKGLLHNGIHFLSLLMKIFGEISDHHWSDVEGKKQLLVKFGNAEALFRETVFGLDDNSMIIQSKAGTLYYLNGGRKCFLIDEKSKIDELPKSEFDQYQKGIYDTCFSYLNGDASDDSFELAKCAQRILEGSCDL